MDNETIKLLSDISGLGIAGMLIIIVFFLISKKKTPENEGHGEAYNSIISNIGVLEEQLSTIQGNHLDHLQSDTTRILNILIEQGRAQAEANGKILTILDEVRLKVK